MSTVLNVGKLFLLLGLGFSYFIGLGWSFLELLLHKKSTSSPGMIPLLSKMPLAIVLGFIINYGISLAFQSLSIGLFTGAAISVMGIWQLGVRHFRNRQIHETLNKWIGTVFIWLLFLSLILFEPLAVADARSIWFFHAKMIFTAGSFGASAGWQHPSLVFSHVDYPNLVPGIAAQATYLLGFWNEYIPKISLAFILGPAIMWLFTFARKSFSFFALVLIFPFSLYILVWIGYMDGYLAIYLSISMLLLGRYVQLTEFIDLISCIICLVLLLYIKNEGQLALLVGSISIVIATLVGKKDGHTDLKSHLVNWENVVVSAIILLPFVLWFIYKQRLGLSNDLEIGTTQSIARIIERIKNNSFTLIVESTYKQIEAALMLLGLLYFATISQKLPIPVAVIPVLSTAVICYCGMIVIYLMTPHDLQWQLTTSANRTMLSISGCIFIACYFILDSLENFIKGNLNEYL